MGADPATNLVISDILPSGLNLISATPSTGSWSSPNWTIGTLTSGALESISIVASANTNNLTIPIQLITNTATNIQDQIDSDTSADSPSVSITILNDFDNDGVMDNTDLDDDNDGILDTTECALVTSNFALNGTASLSSTYTGGDASKAIDGNTNGNWSGGSVAHSSCSTATDWLSIDLGTDEFIDEIRIWNRTDCCSERLTNAYIMISSNPFPSNTNVNESLTNAEFIYQLGNTNGISEITVPAGLRGRYFRLQKSGNNLGVIA